MTEQTQLRTIEDLANLIRRVGKHLRWEIIDEEGGTFSVEITEPQVDSHGDPAAPLIFGSISLSSLAQALEEAAHHVLTNTGPDRDYSVEGADATE